MRYSTEPADAADVPQKFTFNPKEGIDNPALVISDDSEPDLRPRLCLLKREEGQGFGFNLRQEVGCRGHVVQEVTPWSAAKHSGLRNGDHVLEVNEDFVDNQEFSKVVFKVQASGLQLCMLVLGADEYQAAVGQGTDLNALSRAHRGEGCARPRLCHIKSEPDLGLGISVVPVEGTRGRFDLNPVSEGPAEKAGVLSGDRLLWIDGVMTSELKHSTLMKMVKRCEEGVTVLVIDRRSEESYVCRRLPILPAFAIAHNLPHRPKTLHLTQGPKGYGFLLRQEKLTMGRTAHLLREIDPNSPAEAAGMEDGDLLLAVNGELVENLEHEEIVSKIRQSGSRVTFITITIDGREFYNQLGLPPLLFYDQNIAQREQDMHTGPLRPSLCVLHNDGPGFGFTLTRSPDDSVTRVGQVAAGRAGESAGLREGDAIVEVNGQNVEHEHFEEVARRVRNGGTLLTLLVAAREGNGNVRKDDGLPGNPQIPDSAHDVFV